jgi:hypothetical protein
MKKFLLAPLLGALAMFFWGFLYYGISGIPYKALGTPAGDVLPAVAALFPADGTYVMPDPRSPPEALAEQMKRGQFAMVHVRKAGVKEMDPMTLVKGFALEFACCLLLAFIMHKVAGGFQTFMCRFMFCLAVGLLVTLFANGGQAIWWQQAWGWHLMTMLHDVIAFVLAGAVLARFHTPKTT